MLVDDTLELVVDLGKVLIVNAQHTIDLSQAQLLLLQTGIHVLTQLRRPFLRAFAGCRVRNLLHHTAADFLSQLVYLVAHLQKLGLAPCLHVSSELLGEHFLLELQVVTRLLELVLVLTV